MKKGSAFITTGLLLIAAALVLTGYNVWDNERAGKAADAALDRLVPMIAEDSFSESEETPETPAAEPEYPPYLLDPNIEMPVAQIDGNDYIGVLSLPSVDREMPVFSEWNYPNLKISACRYTGSAYLDSMIICAHNYDSCFGSLKNMSYGDPITFTDMDGNVFNYRVIEIETLQPTALDEMSAGDWDLTLFTCTIGGAARVTVRCEKADF